MTPYTKLATAPTDEPVTLTKLKAFLNIDDTVHDGLLSVILPAARQAVEQATDRKLFTQTWDWYAQDWPSVGENYRGEDYEKGDYIELPYGWLQSVTYIKYRGTNGSWSTWGSTNYDVQDMGDYALGRVYCAYNVSWPTSVLYPGYSVNVRYVCGKAEANIDQQLKHAIMYMVTEMFVNRTMEPIDSEFFNTLIAPFKLNNGIY